jgi:hypothetical protein
MLQWASATGVGQRIASTKASKGNHQPTRSASWSIETSGDARRAKDHLKRPAKRGKKYGPRQSTTFQRHISYVVDWIAHLYIGRTRGVSGAVEKEEKDKERVSNLLNSM